MKKADIQTTLDVLIEIHESDEMLMLMGLADGGSVSARECQGRIATVVRFLMKKRVN